MANWECVRGISYIYSNTPLTDAQAAAYNADGFEVGLHINTNCADFTPATLETFYSQQITEWTAKYSSVPPPITQRHHCIAWSDWVTGAKVQLTHGIRLDTSYYFWPPGWVLNRPGFFNGSGMPMRFADLNGDLIDVYHAAPQMTDESGQQYPYTIGTLLDKALGAEGYYGVFTVNAHTDVAQILEADAVVTSALARDVPIVSSRQMLDWLDGRNGSSFEALAWNGNTLSFTVSPAPNANGLQVLAPMQSTAGMLSTITSNGKPVAYTAEVIKGVNYAFFAGAAGSYTLTYAADTTPPTVKATLPANDATGISQGTSIKATFSEAMASATITGNSFQLTAPGNTSVAATVSYDAATRTATLKPTTMLATSTLYTATVKAGANGVKDLAGKALAADTTWSFTTAAGPVCPCSTWNSSTTPGTASANDPNPVELGVKFRTDVDGYITGIRFYKGSANTGIHVGNLWNIMGQSLATATYSNETASGWQQVTFSNPVPVTANTVYVASYYAPNGGYAFDVNYFATAGVDNSPIYLLRNGEDGPNGIYKYGTSGGFPTDTYNASNYWVDVVFTTSVGPDTTPPTVVSRSPANGATGVTTGTTVTAVFSEAMNPASISASTFELQAPNNALIATVNYDAPNRTVTLTPSSVLVANTTYTATIKGGDSGVKDVAGNALASDQSWSFTTAPAGAPNCSSSTSSIWPTNPTPSAITDSDTSSVELGVKFKSTVNGYACGIRFYKGSTKLDFSYFCVAPKSASSDHDAFSPTKERCPWECCLSTGCRL